MFERMRSGMAVLSRDGVHVGRIVDVTEDGIVIEKGLIFHRDFVVPFHDVAQFQGDEIVLSLDKASLRGAHGRSLMPPEPSAAHRDDTPPQQDALDDAETMTPAAVARPRAAAGRAPGVFPYAAPEPALSERRAAGPGWDPMSADEEPAEQKPAPLMGPEHDPLTRY
ncbi:PRC-barrel domain-containing protein [Stigmatella hybrida]|uniref:PRC-barrel domain-containing protein n=1 Tax=Stigmatella hybrida TaxID=394097 RepID=UPI001CDB108D|nr:PRC-barrel domain-containing protein [Stigmatella hybrida]